MTHQGNLRACFDRTLATRPGLQGTIALAWMVDVDGHVMDSKIVSSSIEIPEFEACILSELQRWEFPVSNATTYIKSYPMKFGVGK